MLMGRIVQCLFHSFMLRKLQASIQTYGAVTLIHTVGITGVGDTQYCCGAFRIKLCDNLRDYI